MINNNNVVELISNRNETYSFFVQCACGNELLQFYYYEATNINDEIIGLRYFGHLDSNKYSKRTSFMFTQEEFNQLISYLEELLAYNPKNNFYNSKRLELKSLKDTLILIKDNYGFYKILKFNTSKPPKYNGKIGKINSFLSLLHPRKYFSTWDIYLRETEFQKMYQKLLEIKDMINPPTLQ